MIKINKDNYMYKTIIKKLKKRKHIIKRKLKIKIKKIVMNFRK